MPEPVDDVAELTSGVVRFVRAFGLHRPDDTPCGAGVSVSEAHALAVLATSGPISQRELAAQLCLTKSTVSRLVDLLAGRSWIEVDTSDVDRRCRVLTLTAAGHAAGTTFERQRRERMARLLDRIPLTRQAEVLDALRLLSDAARA